MASAWHLAFSACIRSPVFVEFHLCPACSVSRRRFKIPGEDSPTRDMSATAICCRTDKRPGCCGRRGGRQAWSGVMVQLQRVGEFLCRFGARRMSGLIRGLFPTGVATRCHRNCRASRETTGATASRAFLSGMHPNAASWSAFSGLFVVQAPCSSRFVGAECAIRPHAGNSHSTATGRGLISYVPPFACDSLFDSHAFGVRENLRFD